MVHPGATVKHLVCSKRVTNICMVYMIYKFYFLRKIQLEFIMKETKKGIKGKDKDFEEIDKDID